MNLSDEAIQILSRTAECALTSPEKNEREAAANQLLFLSSYDHWECTKHLFPLCRSNHLRFIVCKAILFIVSNELGPQERSEMQSTVLSYLKNTRENNDTMPPYVRQQLYLIYASALYSNWRLQLISSESTEPGREFDMAAEMVQNLQAHLSPEDTLDCMLEIINYIATQSVKMILYSVRTSFARYVLPYFFEVAANLLDVAPGRALEVCCAALECVPDSTGSEPLIIVRHTTEASIHLARWEGWATALPTVLQHCRRVLVHDPTGPQAAQCGRLLQLCSTLLCPQEDYLASRDAITCEMMLLSGALLQVCQANNHLTDLLRLSADVVVNCFERNEGVVTKFFVSQPTMIDAWAEATQYVLQRFAEDEDDLRQSLMHLFYFIGNVLLPPRPGRPNDSMERSFYGQLLPCGGGGGRNVPIGPQLDGPLGREVTAKVEDLLNAVFQAYFVAVIDRAHLREESQELRTEAGVVLHNERTLLPLSEMLFCDRIDFLPFLVSRLMETIAQHNICASACERLRSPNGVNDEQMLQELLASSTEAQALVDEVVLRQGPLGSQRDLTTSVSLVMRGFFLSRLSVMISIFAIAMVNNTAPRDDTVLHIIAQFAQTLLTDDDRLTDSLLQCLSLRDDDPHGESLLGRAPPTVHVGVIRSLFFFCNCVYESDFSRQPELIDIMLDLLRYVYLYHNDNAPLMVDANLLLQRTVTCGISAASFLGSDKFWSVIKAVKEDRIGSLQFPAACRLPREAREGFYTAFISFVEARYYAGYTVNNVLETILERSLSQDRLLQAGNNSSLEDVLAVTRGITQPDMFHSVLHAVHDNRASIIQLIFKDDTSPSLVVKWLAALCTAARSLLDGDCTSQTPWELASLTIETLCQFFTAISFPPAAGGQQKFFAFASDAVEPSVVYDVADIVQSLCGSRWCNLGVLLVYERSVVERFVSGSMQLLTSVSVPMLMSAQDGRRRVFEALLVACTMEEHNVNTQMHVLLMRQCVWQTVLGHLVKCLAYCFTPELLQLIYLLIQSDENFRQCIPQYVSIDDSVLGATFHEVSVLIAVAPRLEMRELSYTFGIMQMCFGRAPAICTDRMERLLDFCSAYHRVRLRMILTMLRQGRQDILEAYIPVFGQSSKVGILAAW